MNYVAEVTLDGTLERITFRNPDNGYTVARLSSREGEVTIVGSLVGIEEGMPVRLSGEWVDDRKWGRQFKVATCVPDSPKTVVGIEKFLGSKLFPGIGPALAKRIVEKFGREALDVISKTPDRLTEVIGIGSQRAIHPEVETNIFPRDGLGWLPQANDRTLMRGAWVLGAIHAMPESGYLLSLA